MEIKQIRRTVITPVDGSIVSLESLNYLHFMYGPQADLDIILLYVLPALPSNFEDDPVFKKKAAARLKELEKKSISEAEQILSKAKDFILKKGFASERIQTLQQKKEVGIARDICNYASLKKEVDALVISSHGKTKLEAFFIGEVTNKVLEYSR